MRLGHIDRNLRAYAEALRTYPRPPQRDRVLATIDQLLDARLEITGAGEPTDETARNRP